MKPQSYTHRESGGNLLLGVALLDAWRRQDRHSWVALLHNERDDLEAAVVAACRAASHVIEQLADRDVDVRRAMYRTREYALMRRDELGSNDITNHGNKKG